MDYIWVSVDELFCPHLPAVMQHRMMKEAQRAMNPWLGGQPVYAPMSHVSSQMNPLLYPGNTEWLSVVAQALYFWSKEEIFQKGLHQEPTISWAEFCSTIFFLHLTRCLYCLHSQELLLPIASLWSRCLFLILSPRPTVSQLPVSPAVTLLLTITCWIT